MLGRITTKPGGKFEMSEAFVVEKSKMPMPMLRDTKPYSGSTKQNKWWLRLEVVGVGSRLTQQYKECWKFG
ncbi:hypothetical protein HN51_062700, partial [Arachis hypogaea]